MSEVARPVPDHGHDPVTFQALTIAFLVEDAVALVLWAAAYTGLGWVFSDRVETVLGWLAAYLDWVVILGVALIGGAGVWRLLPVRAHTQGHRRMREAGA